MIALGFDRVYQASKRAIVNVSSTNSAANTLNMIGGGTATKCFCGWDSPVYLWRSASPRLALESSKRSKVPPFHKEGWVRGGYAYPKRLPSSVEL